MVVQGSKPGPALVIVNQQNAYPGAYFKDVPAAKFMKDGYPVHMRPGSTDAQVMKQVRPPAALRCWCPAERTRKSAQTT